jgi:ribosomal protein S18 acetylase RimI-like enzyme
VNAAEVRTLLARAFQDDPLMAWVFPEEETRPHAVAAWLGLTVERYLAGAQVEAVRDDGLLTAVALWRLPGWSPSGDPDELPTAGGLLQAVVGAGHAAQVADGFSAMREQAPPPEEPRAYLHFLAVAPGTQGRGLGGTLLERVKEGAVAAGVPLRLETTNAVNLPFYRAHGLRLRSEARLGPSGPTMWALET